VGNLDKIIPEYFTMTDFEQRIFDEKAKEYTNKQWGVDLRLHTLKCDPEIMKSLSKPLYSSRSENNTFSGFFHYNQGFYTEDEDEEAIKLRRAREFIRRIHEDKEKFERKVKSIEQQQEEQEQAEKEFYLQKALSEEQIRWKQRQKKLSEYLKSLTAQQKKRKEDLMKWEKEAEEKKKSKDKPLFRRMKEEFRRKVILPELKLREKTLKKIKEKYKPINRETFAIWEEEHDKRLQEYLKKHPKKVETWEYKRPQGLSRYYSTTEKEFSLQRIASQKELNEKRKKKEKELEYDSLVKKHYLPKIRIDNSVDTMKTLDISTSQSKNDYMLASIQNPVSQSIPETKQSPSRKALGLDYLRESKEIGLKNKSLLLKLPENSFMSPRNGSNSSKLNHTAAGLSKITTATTMKKDYLGELRESGIIKKETDYLDSILKNHDMPSPERTKILQQESQKLEEKIKKYETIRSLGGKKRGLIKEKDEEEMDEIFIYSILTKLEILNSSLE